MFGILVGTLNKAKIEDKERNASEAVGYHSFYIRPKSEPLDLQAKKRHLIEQRLQAKLKKETDSVRRAEEAKKDKTTANRKEEDLQLKDSVVCLVYLSHQILTLVTINCVVQTASDTSPASLQLFTHLRCYTG